MRCEVGWEKCKILLSIFIALYIELGFSGEVVYIGIVVLVAFDMAEDKRDGDPVDGLVNLIAQIIIIGDGPQRVWYGLHL